MKSINNKGGDIHLVRLFALHSCSYFIKDSEGMAWKGLGEYAEATLKKGRDGVCDVAVSADGAWIIARPDRFESSTGVSKELGKHLAQFYSNQRARRDRRRADIAAYDAREERERQERARAEQEARDTAAREAREKEEKERREKEARDRREKEEKEEKEREAKARQEIERRETTEREAAEHATADRRRREEIDRVARDTRDADREARARAKLADVEVLEAKLRDAKVRASPISE